MIDLGDGAALRPVAKSDADELYATVSANRAHLVPWMPWAGDERREATEDFLTDAVARAASREAQSFLILDGGAVAGTVGVHHTDWLNLSAMLGYWVAADAQGRGLVTRAVAALCDRCFGEGGLHRLEIRTNPANARSRAVAERLGFAEEGTARESERHPDGFRDLVVYALLAQDWRR